MDQQPIHVTSLDEPVTKKQFQDMLADVVKLCAFVMRNVRMETFLKEHIPITHQRGNQNPEHQNTRTKPQFQFPNILRITLLALLRLMPTTVKRDSLASKKLES